MKTQRILQFVTCFLLLVAVAINRDGRVLGYDISATDSGAKAEENPKRISSDGSLIISTQMLAKDVYGFGGNVPLEIHITSQRIDSVVPLANSESPAFFNKVLASGLLNQWNGLTPEKAINQKVDAVTGATMSSSAIIQSVQKGLAYAIDKKTGSNYGMLTDLRFWCVIATVLAGMCIPLYLKGKRYRNLQLMLNVVVLGFWSGSFLSLSTLVNLCSNGVMLSAGWIVAILLVAIAFIFPFFGKTNHYCNWICPLGSCQELIGKCIPYKIKIKPKVIERLTLFREALWIIIMSAMWLSVGFEIMDYELFTAFLFQQASWAMIIVALAFAALSGVVQRPYCRFVCPTGTIIKFSQQTK